MVWTKVRKIREKFEKNKENKGKSWGKNLSKMHAKPAVGQKFVWEILRKSNENLWKKGKALKSLKVNKTKEGYPK